MARKIEHLLKVMADLNRFTNENFETSGKRTDDFELSETDLDLIAAAAAMPWEQESGKDQILEDLL